MGRTTFNFDLTLASNDTQKPILAFVIQSEGIEAIGTTDQQEIELGGSSGINGKAAVVFDPTINTVRLIEAGDNGKLSRSTVNLI